jgi:L-amino acid N-acyltransferase YncA
MPSPDVATIRPATEEDAEPTAAIYAPVVLGTFISFELEPPTPGQMRERIASTLRRWPWLVCEQDGRVLGYAYGSEHRSRAAYQWSADVSVYVHERARRLGVGRALYSSLLPLLALQGYHNAFAGIALPNPASVALHEALGFTPVGVYRSVGYKLGAWRDVGWWQRPLQQHAGPPRPLLPPGAVLGSEEAAAALASGLALLSKPADR